MKIIFVIPDLSSGGAERVISILSDSFVKRELDVDVLLLQEHRVCYTVSDKVNIVYLGENLLTCSQKKACQIMRGYFKKQKEQYGKVIAVPFLDVSLKRVLVATFGLKIPIIASERNDPYQKGRGLVNRIKANLPYCLASHCVFQTPGAREYYGKVVQKKGSVIMNPLMMPGYVSWKGQKSKRMVSVGRLEPQKNQMLLINAFAQIHKIYPEYTLDIYGEGSLRKSLQQRIDELGLRDTVFLRGYSADIYAILEESLLFVLSSDYEGLSNALIEAMAVGMPVISTDHPCGGAKVLIQNNENGILVPVNDESAIVLAMKQVIEDADLALALGERARLVRELLSIDRVTTEWKTVFDRV